MLRTSPDFISLIHYFSQDSGGFQNSASCVKHTTCNKNWFFQQGESGTEAKNLIDFR